MIDVFKLALVGIVLTFASCNPINWQEYFDMVNNPKPTPVYDIGGYWKGAKKENIRLIGRPPFPSGPALSTLLFFEDNQGTSGRGGLPVDSGAFNYSILGDVLTMTYPSRDCEFKIIKSDDDSLILETIEDPSATWQWIYQYHFARPTIIGYWEGESAHQIDSFKFDIKDTAHVIIHDYTLDTDYYFMNDGTMERLNTSSSTTGTYIAHDNGNLFMSVTANSSAKLTYEVEGDTLFINRRWSALFNRNHPYIIHYDLGGGTMQFTNTQKFIRH